MLHLCSKKNPLLSGITGFSAAAAASAIRNLLSRGVHSSSSPSQQQQRYLPRDALAGQPTHCTHPNVLGLDELAPGLHISEFQARRRNLARLMPPGSIAIIPAASLAYVTGVIPYPYRQDADFLYLTGLQQQSVAIVQTDGSAGYSYQLYVPSADVEKERWDGAWLGQQAAQQVFKADEVYSILELPARVQQLAASASAVLFDFDRHNSYQFQSLRQSLHEAIGKGKTMPLKPHMHRLRWVKSPGELALMRSSATIAAQAMQRCMALSHAGVHEQLLATEFECGVKLAGASRLAYPVVAGGGADSCTIHYSRNDKQVGDGQVLLMDAGCEYHGYVSDVTRTWPVNGRYTAEQRQVYETVLEVRRRCLEAAVPGNTLGKVHQLSVQLLSEGLRDLGLLPLATLQDFQKGLYREFYCHSVGHYLGMDVHDTNTVGPHRTLEPGVVMAIEPGLYIPDHPQFGAYAGIGVRIEDDVLVTHNGAEVLSDAVPVDPDHIEALVGAAAGDTRMRTASAGSHSSCDEPAVAFSAAVA
ncbi:peptidase M24, structural domain-containing protein [Scenedesmus sp. NREL 46B-D3]|nr:peptidase M24, structural domain-containing protein [Scenedesmus sp. NREL 46B-D3]